ncbi:MAG TPA: leucine-rich repeat domain-containing protein [Bacteroidia bacterium]|nr:leucine-rich repeat domain-containing protein [Bacteroidia bacterium]
MYTARNLEDALEAPLETGELFLSGRGLTDFPMEVFQLVNLRVLDLSQNLLRRLPEGIADLERLEVLNLRNNQLREIPAEIGQLQRLQRLDLDENQLAALPQELASCEALRVLRLNDNSFGTWPGQALSIRLESLTLGYNQFTALPDTIRHLASLSYLDVRHNRLRTLPDGLALIEGLDQVLLEGNPLDLAVNASDPEAVLERFFKELRPQKPGSPPKYPAATRQCWLRLLLNAPDVITDFGLATCTAALDSPMAMVREAAKAVLPQILPSPIPISGNGSILFAGQFTGIPKAETERNLVAAGFKLVKRLQDAETIVVLGERPGAIRELALQKGNPLAFEGHLVTWIAASKGEYLTAAPAANPMFENLGRLIRSYKRENIEIALMMMAKAGVPAGLLTDLLGIRLFHPEMEVRQKAGEAFAQFADRQVKAFVDRQLAQSYKEEEYYDVQALVAALIRNPGLDADALVRAAMDLKGAGPALVMLLPESARAAQLQHSIKEGQLHLAGVGLTEFPAMLQHLQGLRFLMLSRNQLTHLPEDCAPFSKLEMLDLAENHLMELPASIGKLKFLTGLDLSQNRLKHLPETIAEMVHLEALRLDRNPLQTLPPTLPQLSRLEMLGLYGCRFTHLPPVVWEMQQLRALDLGENNLRSLPDALVGFQQLESLGLKDNPLQELPEWIGHLQALRFLDLSLMPARRLPASLQGHARLERIYLVREDSMDWEQVLPILASMPRLKYVYLRGKKIVRTMQLHIEDRLPQVRVMFNA